MTFPSRLLAVLATLLSLAVGMTLAAPAAQSAIPRRQFTHGEALTDEFWTYHFAYLTRMAWIKFNRNGYTEVSAELVPDVGGDPGSQTVVLHDDRADGRRVGLHWKIPGTRKRGLCVNKRGKDNNGSGNGSGTFCTFRIPEGRRLVYRIGSCNQSVKPCGKADNWWRRLDSWSWQRLDRAPYMSNGWMDYRDDADNIAREDGCDETAPSHPDC